VVKLLTIDADSEGFRGVPAFALVIRGGKGRSSLGESGANEGNEVRDLSEEAMDDAELDMYEACLRGLFRTVWKRCDFWLFAEAAEICEADLCRFRSPSESTIFRSYGKGLSRSPLPPLVHLRRDVCKASKWHVESEASVKAEPRKK